MASSELLSVFLTCFTLLFAIPPATGDHVLTAYEGLQQYDFSVGLLSTGVTSYEIDTSTGEFSVYKSTITEKISKGKFSDHSSVQVKILFFTINIIEVTNDGDELSFFVGITSASFPIDNFYESPQCGCGFDCVNALKTGTTPATKFNLKCLASSS